MCVCERERQNCSIKMKWELFLNETYWMNKCTFLSTYTKMGCYCSNDEYERRSESSASDIEFAPGKFA